MNVKKYIHNPEKIILVMMGYGLFNWMRDEAYLKLRYKILTGKQLKLEEPQTFNEKLQWLKLYDRKNEYTKLVDKYEVKKIVKSKLGTNVIIPTLGVWEKVEDIEFDRLPEQFVLKCTHDSGGIVICKNKKEFDFELAKKKLTQRMEHNFFYLSREWPYKNVKPRIIAEKYIVPENGASALIDYKLMCFNGTVKCLYVYTNRYGEAGKHPKDGLCETAYDTKWNRIPFEWYYPEESKAIPKPIHLDKMILFAEKLASNIPFVRVDFYENNGKLYFGEMTFFPGGGTENFASNSTDYELGSWIELPDIKKKIR